MGWELSVSHSAAKSTETKNGWLSVEWRSFKAHKFLVVVVKLSVTCEYSGPDTSWSKLVHPLQIRKKCQNQRWSISPVDPQRSIRQVNGLTNWMKGILDGKDLHPSLYWYKGKSLWGRQSIVSEGYVPISLSLLQLYTSYSFCSIRYE